MKKETRIMTEVLVSGVVGGVVALFEASAAVPPPISLGSASEIRNTLLAQASSAATTGEQKKTTAEATSPDGAENQQENEKNKGTQEETKSPQSDKTAEAKCGEGKCGEGKCGS